MNTPSPGARLARFALNRFGFGPRPESLAEVTDRGIERWLEDQLDPGTDPNLDGRLVGHSSLNASIGELLTRSEANPRVLATARLELLGAHFIRAVHGKNQLQEVLTDFWFNHFNVFGGDRLTLLGLIRYEYDAIRPFVLGRFRDLLGAVAHSWSMMAYLDNYLSSARSINENYARELMELHTLGVDGGYSQRDVEEVARAFTGWGLNRGGGFAYRGRLHDDGAKDVLGRRLPPGQGQKDGEDVLDLLASHPATARFVATKLARRFVSDDPPDSLVGQVASSFSSSGGDLSEVMRTLLGSAELWDEAFGSGKLRTPHEYVTAVLRAVGAEVANPRALLGADGLQSMGMPTYGALDPTGWSDRGSDWIPNPGSHLTRFNFALSVVSQTLPGIGVDLRALIGNGDPGDAAAAAQAVDRLIFAETLPPEVLAACGRVSGSSALPAAFRAVGLALASPAFQVK